MPTNHIRDINDPVSRVAVTLTSDRIFGKVFTLRECAEILHSYRVDAVILTISFLKHLNEHVYLDADISREAWKASIGNFIRDFFDDVHRPRVLLDVKEHLDCFQPLSNQALLATLELALKVCPHDSGREFATIEDRQMLAKVLLSFQYSLLSDEFQKHAAKISSFQEVTDSENHEFVRNYLAQNTFKYYRRALGRLYAFCFVAEIREAASMRLNKPFNVWFTALFGTTPESYFKLVGFLIVPAYRLNKEAPNCADLYFSQEKFYETVREPERNWLLNMMRLATSSVETPLVRPNLESSLTDFMYNSMRFFQHPILQFKDRSICVSPSLLINKFAVGLPYLAIELLRHNLGRELVDSEVKDIRSPIGYIFESYILFLMRKWLIDWPQTKILSPYIIKTGKKSMERDIVIIRRDTAFVFEIKSTVAGLNLRKSGVFDKLDQMVADGSRQAYEAASALIEGNAYDMNNAQITGIRRVIPCVITYDAIPLSNLHGLSYERHLEKKTGLNLFKEQNGIYPLQFFDADFIESWEMQFDMSPESGAPFGYLEQRARDGRLRYLEVIESEVKLRPRPESPKPFASLETAAMNFWASEVKTLLSR